MTQAEQTEQAGLLPQSDELHSTGPESLAELLSRDPEGYSKQDLESVVAALRAQRAKFAQAESEGAKLPKQTKITSKAASLIASAKAEDLDL